MIREKLLNIKAKIMINKYITVDAIEKWYYEWRLNFLLNFPGACPEHIPLSSACDTEVSRFLTRN